jgi:hypothetical protein
MTIGCIGRPAKYSFSLLKLRLRAFAKSFHPIERAWTPRLGRYLFLQAIKMLLTRLGNNPIIKAEVEHTKIIQFVRTLEIRQRSNKRLL